MLVINIRHVNDTDSQISTFFLIKSRNLKRSKMADSPVLSHDACVKCRFINLIRYFFGTPDNFPQSEDQCGFRKSPCLKCEVDYN